MDFLKQYILAIAVSAVVGGIVLILSPNGSTQKAVRTAVSMVILCVMLTPFTSGIKIDLPENLSVTEPQNIKENTVEMFKNTVSEKIKKIAEQNGVKAQQISIDIEIDDSNEMKINSVKIFVADNKSLQKFKEEISSTLGIEAEIEVQE